MTNRLNTLALEAHLTLALLHAQGVVYHLTDPRHRSLLYAGVHLFAGAFSAVSVVKHLPDVDDGLRMNRTETWVGLCTCRTSDTCPIHNQRGTDLTELSDHDIGALLTMVADLNEDAITAEAARRLRRDPPGGTDG